MNVLGGRLLRSNQHLLDMTFMASLHHRPCDHHDEVDEVAFSKCWEEIEIDRVLMQSQDVGWPSMIVWTRDPKFGRILCQGGRGGGGTLGFSEGDSLQDSAKGRALSG